MGWYDTHKTPYGKYIDRPRYNYRRALAILTAAISNENSLDTIIGIATNLKSRAMDGVCTCCHKHSSFASYVMEEYGNTAAIESMPHDILRTCLEKDYCWDCAIRGTKELARKNADGMKVLREAETVIKAIRLSLRQSNGGLDVRLYPGVGRFTKTGQPINSNGGKRNVKSKRVHAVNQ